MPVLDREGTQVWRRRTTGQAMVRWLGWLVGVAVFVVCWQRISDATTWFFVWDAPRIAGDIWTRATPPRWEYIAQLGRPIWDTFNIATLGTLLALCMAVPVALIAPSAVPLSSSAGGSSPSPLIGAAMAALPFRSAIAFCWSRPWSRPRPIPPRHSAPRCW